ncbi:phage tail protein [Staphylococcus ureilyticus]|uniref:tail tube TT1 domain-containing protein n=1 Tax=Staphylococcus ureilyticus TaxID=94138 RepID=UPI0029297E1B|nr:phage tail protein [Staphylococcus ureilyticus]MDU9371537.1 phage tail protein [Staphylococcus ureilyticus]
MALILKDLKGNAYPVETVTSHTVRMNGDGMLTFNVIENRQTENFINDISKMWQVENVTGTDDKMVYVVVLAKRKALKDKQIVEVTAKEEQFDYLETHRVYENITGSRTAVDYFNTIFNGTPFSYTMLDDAYAKEWENAGDGQSKFDMFLKGLERYGFEFQYEPASKTFKLGERISRRPAYYISKRLNANDISFEEDATNFYTYARGYGDYEGEDNLHEANLTREYPENAESPMIELFGIREAPPITDGRITKKATLDKQLEDLVEQSAKLSIELDFVALGSNYPFAQPEIGDEIPVIDDTINFNRLLRIHEIKTTRDAHHVVTKQSIVVGDPKREIRYRQSQAGAISNMNDLIAGRTKIRQSVLPAAINEATEMLQKTSSELSFSEQGITAVDKNNPNYVTLLNSSGLGVSKDGGETFHNAITRGAINANLITAGALNADYIRGGTLDANLVNVVGGDGDKYITMKNDEMTLYGTYQRTWQGKTTINDVFTRFKDGHLRFRNNDEQRSLYFSDFGISTYIDGDSSDASGTLEFFDYTYSSARGVTLQSGLGVVALRSDSNRVVIEADDTVNIGSNKYSIYMRPYSSTRMGVNEFQFYVKDNPSATATDGALLYGNLTGSGTKMGSGLRFGKNMPVVYATNENGDIGSGYFYGAGFQGDWMAKNSNVYACVDGALRVTDPRGYNNGFPNYKDIQAKDIQAGSIRTMSGNFYIGVSSNELRVTNNLLYNGGNVGYKPIRASAFNDASLAEYKRDIKAWNHDALTDITERTQLYSFKYKDDEKNKQHYGLVIGDGYETPESLIDDDGVNLYDMLAHSYRAIQQLNEKVEALSNGK